MGCAHAPIETPRHFGHKEYPVLPVLPSSEVNLAMAVKSSRRGLRFNDLSGEQLAAIGQTVLDSLAMNGSNDELRGLPLKKGRRKAL
jgi:hypothetical protein